MIGNTWETYNFRVQSEHTMVKGQLQPPWIWTNVHMKQLQDQGRLNLSSPAEITKKMALMK
eukprot:12915492-Prorocentrum_lima.AAC.1